MRFPFSPLTPLAAAAAMVLATATAAAASPSEAAPQPAPGASPAPAAGPLVSPPEFKPGISLGMAFQFYTIDYVGDSPVSKAYPVGWNRILFTPTGAASPTFSFKSRFAIDNFGVNSSGLGSGHIRSSSLDTGSPFYVDWAYASWKPEDMQLHVGLLMLNQEMKFGSAIANPFDTAAVYSIGLTRYGGVGTPPLTAGGALDAANSRPGDWLMGTNVALETLDPNSTYVNFPAPALGAVYKRAIGPVKFALGTMDGTPGASAARANDPAAAKSLYLPANFPQTAPQRQGYSAMTLEGNVGPVRVQGGLRADNQTFGTLAGKSSALTLETGDEKLAASLTLAGAGLPLDTLGGYVWSNNVAGSGFGLGLGLKARGMGFLTPSSASFLSAGPLLRTPAYGLLPAFTLAAQQTQGPAGGALGSGLTLETAWRPVAALPTINLEVSGGKFDPAADNGLLNFSRPFTHVLYSVMTTFSF